MKVGVITELVYIRVNGNRPSTDSDILRSDIRFWLPVAINYVLDKAHNVNIETEGDRDMPSEFYVEVGPVPVNTNTTPPSFVFDDNIAALKGNAGVRFVYDNCGNYYTPVPDYAMPNVAYYSKLTPCMGWYRRTGTKGQLYGANDMLESIYYQKLMKPESLTDSDDAPIQAGLEKDVMDLLVDWFTGAKRMPYDSVTDGRDVVNAAK